MTSNVDICNRALNAIGIKKKISSLTQDSIEAQSCNLVLTNLRDDLLRMAPWDCGLCTTNLVYITSAPGTPEGVNFPVTNQWYPGLPPPPWAYEYQYPLTCLRACWIIPSLQTGFSGVPITTAVTGGTPSLWTPPIKFKVQTDEFYSTTGVTVVAGGSNYAVGDIVTLFVSPTPPTPIGAPAQLTVNTVDGGGAILTATVLNQIMGSDVPLGGSYFFQQGVTAAAANPIAVNGGISPGAGATFTLAGPIHTVQRVILTNEQLATLSYVKQITDPNVMDTLFQSAWTNLLSASLCIALTGDKAMANSKIAIANQSIIEARKADGNEGLTVNDRTPDWIRVRGVEYTEYCSGPYGFDWGGLWPMY